MKKRRPTLSREVREPCKEMIQKWFKQEGGALAEVQRGIRQDTEPL